MPSAEERRANKSCMCGRRSWRASASSCGYQALRRWGPCPRCASPRLGARVQMADRQALGGLIMSALHLLLRMLGWYGACLSSGPS